MEVGIDIEQNSRFEYITKNLEDRIFTAEEKKYASSFADKSARLCSIWCVKEATIKAFNKKLFLSDIEILHEKQGKPYVKKTEKIKKLLSEQNLSEIKISISHSKDYSTAICILY